MSPAPRSAYKDVSEAQWQEQVFDTLHLHGWKVAHFRPAQLKDKDGKARWVTPVAADGKGFPDLLCTHAKAGDILVAELKTEYASATPEQYQWLAWFEAAGVDAYVWKPSMVDEVIARIAAPQKRVRRAHRPE